MYYSHLKWPEVAGLVANVWKGLREERVRIHGLLDAIEHMTDETPSVYRGRVAGIVARAPVNQWGRRGRTFLEVTMVAGLTARCR